MTDLVPESETTPDGNARPYSVSELAFALKRTLEDAYGFVRLRGELSKVTHHGNGHVYLTIKDDRAAIDGVVWKGSVKNLSIRPEQGLEVVITGKITTYPAGSRYQIVIETMEAAGIGALLAQLERLKARLQAEGLFEPGRKKPLPAMPAVVGVITSPTGAVIRDILHRIRDRWPCRVIVWPVVVQGDAAAGQVRAAIDGFNAMTPDGPVPRPDILIVARGGGSVEDLWAFNDEQLARTVAASAIPLISAVGHETDTTLIDFVSDRRAPTPTAAAEIATPVLAELRALTSDLSSRLHRAGGRLVDDRRGRIETLSRSLARVPDLLELASQRFNHVESRLAAGLQRNLASHRTDLLQVTSRLSPALLSRPQQVWSDRLTGLSARLAPAVSRTLVRAEERFDVTKARLSAGLQANISSHRADFLRATRGFSPLLLERPRAVQTEHLARLSVRLQPAMARSLDRAGERLLSLSKLHASVDPSAPLKRGFARVHRTDGGLVREGASLSAGEAVRLVFADTARDAVIDGTPSEAPPLTAPISAPARAPKPRTATAPPNQGDLF